MSEISKEDLHLDHPKERNSIEPVVKDNTKTVSIPKESVKIRKKSLGKRFMESIIESDMDTVKEYVIQEVIIPGIKDILVDAFKDGVDILFNGKDNRRPAQQKSKYGTVHTTSYSSFYDSPRTTISDPYNHPAASIDDIVLGTRAQAEMVLNDLQRYLDKYENVPVSRLYDCIDMTCPWTYNRFGWTSLEGSGYRHVRDGYLLVLPRPVVLDRK